MPRESGASSKLLKALRLLDCPLSRAMTAKERLLRWKMNVL